MQSYSSGNGGQHVNLTHVLVSVSVSMIPGSGQDICGGWVSMIPESGQQIASGWVGGVLTYFSVQFWL